MGALGQHSPNFETEWGRGRAQEPPGSPASWRGAQRKLRLQGRHEGGHQQHRKWDCCTSCVSTLGLNLQEGNQEPGVEQLSEEKLGQRAGC